jgi:trk system potassium uptake protein TrkA
MRRKSFAILGLGIFGSTVAKTLAEYGYDVIGVDNEISCVDRMSDIVTQAVQADFTDIEQLRQAGVQDVDVAIIATGSKLEASVMAIIQLKELGVPYIMAKAKNKVYMQILLKVGADRVVRPEKEMGERVAKSLMSQNIIDMIDIDDDYSIMELSAPSKWVGHALKDLDLRNQYGVNVLGIRTVLNPRLNLGMTADYVVHTDDTLLVIVENNKFEALEYEGKI